MTFRIAPRVRRHENDSDQAQRISTPAELLRRAIVLSFSLRVPIQLCAKQS